MQHRAVKTYDYSKILYELLSPFIDKKPVVLEIGLAAGGSIKAYIELMPNGTYYSIDNAPACNPNGVFVFVGQQEDKKFVKKVADYAGPFDIIIDDGGHFASMQQASLDVLLSYLKPNGIYIVEDLHCASSHVDNGINTIAYIKQLPYKSVFYKTQRSPEDLCVIYKGD